MVARIDPTAPRKKYALLKWSRKWNVRNPGRMVAAPHGFNPESPHIGKPAREFVRAMQRATGLKVTGQFDEATMRHLLPPGIRGVVMAKAHAELGEHEWPPNSNNGPIVEYLHAVGISGGQPWCAAFVTWDLKECGFKHFPVNPAYAPSWLEFARHHGLLKPLDRSLPGDLWLWNWDGGLIDHIGFCDEGVKGATAYYLDGNVGAYGGSVTDAARPAGGIADVIDLVKLHNLKAA